MTSFRVNGKAVICPLLNPRIYLRKNRFNSSSGGREALIAINVLRHRRHKPKRATHGIFTRHSNINSLGTRKFLYEDNSYIRSFIYALEAAIKPIFFLLKPTVGRSLRAPTYNRFSSPTCNEVAVVIYSQKSTRYHTTVQVQY